MYHPTTRVLAVLALLQAHKRLTGAELAQRLEVNVRTLRRYVTMLQDLGVPIIAERGRNGAYELDTTYKLPPLMFTNDEAVAVAMGLLATRQLGLADSIPALESAGAKMERVLPPELKVRVQALIETITLDLNMMPTESSGAVMMTISTAVQHHRQVRLRYRSAQGDETERGFDPYGVAYRQGKWYVAGWCHLRQGLRAFRLDRVVQVELTNTDFVPPEHFDTLAHIVHSIASLPRHYTFEILLKTDLPSAQKQIMSVLGVLEPCEDGILLRGSTDDLEWLSRELSRLPFPFTIIEPLILHHTLRDHTLALLQIATVSSPFSGLSNE